MEIRTTLAALATGEAVLSGRFGPSAPLVAPTAQEIRAKGGVNIRSAARRRLAGQPTFQLTLELEASVKGETLTVADLDRMPQPIISVGDDILPSPYYFEDSTDKKVVTVRAVAQASAQERHTVWFRSPFMGLDWISSVPFPEDAPIIARLGGDEAQTLIITTANFPPPKPGQPNWAATLDKEYVLGTGDALTRLTNFRLKLTVPSEILARYKKLHLGRGDISYVLDIPPMAGVATSATLDESEVPPIVKRGEPAVVDLKGSGLAQIRNVTIGTAILPFQVYAEGACIRLFLSDSVTAHAGKFEISLQTQNEALAASLYVLGEGLQSPEAGLRQAN
jgi:hypothetical protein